MKKLKVWGGESFYHRSQQYRGVVAASSQKEAAIACELSLYHFREYFAETGNDLEVEAAMSEPGTIFVVIGRGKDERMVKWDEIKTLPHTPETGMEVE